MVIYRYFYEDYNIFFPSYIYIISFLLLYNNYDIYLYNEKYVVIVYSYKALGQKLYDALVL